MVTKDFGSIPEILLSEKNEYSLYCAILGFKIVPGKLYRSPLRDDYKLTNYDGAPSFCIFETPSNRLYDYMWKDFGKSGVNSGSIFTLIQLLNSCTKQQVWRIVDKLDLELVEAIPQQDAIIDFKESDWTEHHYKFWKQFNVTPEILKRHGVLTAKYLRVNGTTVYVPMHCYIYPQNGMFKVYRPYSGKENKFRSNYDSTIVEGEDVLLPSSKLIITKSRKDVMCLESFGYSAVSARSENTVIATTKLDYFRTLYQDIIVFFDNDGKESSDKYPFEKVFLPLKSDAKDPSDYCKLHGKEKCKKILEQLLGKPNGDTKRVHGH